MNKSEQKAKDQAMLDMAKEGLVLCLFQIMETDDLNLETLDTVELEIILKQQ